MEPHDAVWLGSGILPSRVYCLISAAILIFDYLCTFDREVDLIWKRGVKSSATALFFVNRYIPYAYVFSALAEYWTIAHSQEACQHRDIGNAVIIAISLATSELILGLRTWAIWNKSWTILVVLMVTASIKVPLVLISLYQMLKDVHYINISPNEIICISPVVSRWSWETLTFAIILIVESLIAVLTLVKVVEAKHSSSKWFFKVHYMGIIYYIFNLLVTIINVVGSVYLHNSGMASFAVLQGVFQSVLSTRIIFLAREPSELEERFSNQTLSTHYFVPPWRYREGVSTILP